MKSTHVRLVITDKTNKKDQIHTVYINEAVDRLEYFKNNPYYEARLENDEEKKKLLDYEKSRTDGEDYPDEQDLYTDVACSFKLKLPKNWTNMEKTCWVQQEIGSKILEHSHGIPIISVF